MRGKPVTKEDVLRIKSLRRRGYSLPEIRRAVRRGNAVVHQHIQGVKVIEPYLSILRAKQGGSKIRAQKAWSNARNEAIAMLHGDLRDSLLILASLYWGEGNKSELNLINSDSNMVRLFVVLLHSIGVERRDLKVSARAFDDLPVDNILKFWSKITNVPVSRFGKTDVLTGKKKGKLRFGMCRIRVRKSAKYFKLIMSVIDLLKSGNIPPRSSTDRTAAS